MPIRPALLGSVELVEGDRAARSRSCTPLSKPGRRLDRDAAYLDRFVDEQRLAAASDMPAESEEQVPYLRFMAQIGRRLAEMHLALASRRRIARLRAGADRPDDVKRWIDELKARAERVFDAWPTATRRPAGSATDR